MLGESQKIFVNNSSWYFRGSVPVLLTPMVALMEELMEESMVDLMEELIDRRRFSESG